MKTKEFHTKSTKLFSRIASCLYDEFKSLSFLIYKSIKEGIEKTERTNSRLQTLSLQQQLNVKKYYNEKTTSRISLELLRIIFLLGVILTLTSLFNDLDFGTICVFVACSSQVFAHTGYIERYKASRKETLVNQLTSN